jgi:GABA permease
VLRNNPFRSEADAFRFLLAVIGLCSLIVIGSLINVWLGLAVFIVESGFVGWFLLFRGRAERPVLQAPAPHPAGERRILVIANETVGGRTLLSELKTRASTGRTRVFVVSPALNTPVKHWTNEEEPARAAAQKRLDHSLTAIRGAGLDASGEIGDDDPLQAIEDALRTFAPDELIISTHPEGRSNWLERGVVEHARERFALPVTHVVVDLAAESAAAPTGY